MATLHKSFLAALATCVLVPALVPGAVAADSVTITLRVAPVGFLVPSHWLLCLTGECPEAVWLVDPVEHPELQPIPGVAGCILDVEDLDDNGRVDGGDVLDTATGTGCITGWDADVTDFGRFVTMVDDLRQASWPASWWFIQISGFPSPVGIDDMDLSGGESVEFVYLLGP